MYAPQVAATTHHGNCRRNFAPYQRTDPMVLHEARTKILNGEKPEDVRYLFPLFYMTSN